MKKIIVTAVLLITHLVSAQVGIHTQTPQATLHIQGNMQFTNSLYLGGTETTPGNPGNSNEVLASQGEGKPPVWIKLEDRDVSKVVEIGKQPSAQSGNGFQYTKIGFNNSLINNEYITYNSATRVFTVIKEGYYDISAYARIVVTETPYGGTSVLSIRDYQSNNHIFINSIGNPAGSDTIYSSISNIVFLTAGQQFTVEAVHTRSYNVSLGNISIIYVAGA